MLSILNDLKPVFKRSAMAVFIAAPFIAGPLYAESTVTIPVPESVTNESKNLVLTITVPTALERTYQQQPKKEEDKPKKNNYSKYFDLSPFPNMVNREELDVIQRFAKRGIIDDVNANVIKQKFITNNYEMARTLSALVSTVLKTVPEDLAKAGVTRTDILDLVKVFDNYTKELKMFSTGGKDREKLTKLSQKLSFTDGEVKVIKVETNDIGGTVIHMTLNNTKGRYVPQYISKLEPLPVQTSEVQTSRTDAGATNPESLQFSSGQPPAQQPVNNGQQPMAPDTPPPPEPPAPDPNGGTPPAPDPNGGTPPAPDPNGGTAPDPNGGTLPPPPPDAPPAP
ncbi:MAG TPA: hypothetical protein PKK26_09150 [Candidatus Wallbacteria bacterium]|nr:hypothetical protein [Candidatus Wallbacteria bacterium]